MSKLDDTLKQLEKDLGKGTVMTLESAPALDAEVVPTGSLLIDRALGVGGIPLNGGVVEIYGVPSAGKTTLTQSIIANAQKLGHTCAFIDCENSLSPEYSRKLGIDTSKLLFSQPNSGESVFTIIKALAESGEVRLIVVDSVSAITPLAEQDSFEGSQMGLQARLMSRGLRVISNPISKNNCTVIFINQLREKIGVIYGNPEYTSGGKALPYYASLRIELRKGEAIKRGSEVIGNIVKVKVAKNKYAVPFKTCEVELIYGEGFQMESEILTLAVDMDIIQKSGSWYSFNGEKIGQGADNVKVWLKENPEIFDEITEKVKSNLNKKEG